MGAEGVVQPGQRRRYQGLEIYAGVVGGREKLPGETMQKAVRAFASIVLLLGGIAPAFAQQQTPKAGETPDIRKQEAKGAESSEVRKKAKRKPAPSGTRKRVIAPKISEGLAVRKKAKKKPVATQLPKPKSTPEVPEAGQKKP